MNKCIFIGNLTKDPELSTTQNGTSYARFTIAVSRRFANADGERVTDFINCIAWRSQGENLAKYCHKGDKISVVGELQNRSYEDGNGIKRHITEIIADEVEFINTKKNDENSGGNKPKKPTMQAYDGDEDIPF
jgi:single-strand DNA-binding protein